MRILIVIGTFLILYKFITNFIKYLQTKKYLKIYLDWIKEPNWEIYQHKSLVVKLILEAGVQETFVPNSQPLGFGQVANSEIPVLHNFGINNSNIIGLTVVKFKDAIGVYKRGFLNAFNPIYWIEFFVFLPKNLLKYIGIQSENSFVKFLQVIYWIASITYIFFKPEIELYLRNMIGKG